jgi:hypothetical protein
VKTCIVCSWSGDWPCCQNCDESAWLVEAEESPELFGDMGLVRRAQPEVETDSEAA